jgi:hypothetical protein
MELKEFVSQTLTQIFEGIREAQNKFVDREQGEINPATKISVDDNQKHGRLMTQGLGIIQHIDFDVAVTATEGTETNGRIGIFTGVIGLGSQGQSATSNNVVSRIKFQVPVTLPQPVKKQQV